MSQSINVEELEQLIAQMEPHQVEAEYGNHLNEEARAYFESFKETCKHLDELSGQMNIGLPPVPEFVHQAPPKVIPFPSRSVPAWAVPLTAAAVMCLALLMPRPAAEMKPTESVADPYKIIRTMPSETPELDNQIADAFLKRAQTFQEKKQVKQAWEDYIQALRYLPHNATDQRDLIFTDMTIIAEEQGDQEMLNFVQALEKQQ